MAQRQFATVSARHIYSGYPLEVGEGSLGNNKCGGSLPTQHFSGHTRKGGVHFPLWKELDWEEREGAKDG